MSTKEITEMVTSAAREGRADYVDICSPSAWGEVQYPFTVGCYEGDGFPFEAPTECHSFEEGWQFMIDLQKEIDQVHG